MADKPYKEGTIKLTWINPDNYKVLHSEMFNDINTALNKAKSTPSLGNNWLIFKLFKTDGTSYSWEVLPYGKHKGYVNGMKLRDNLLFRYGSIALMMIGAYSLVKLIIEKK
jgi:hypothetical protein